MDPSILALDLSCSLHFFFAWGHDIFSPIFPSFDENTAVHVRFSSCSDEDPCRGQSEEEDSPGDHKGEMHPWEEHLLIAHQRSQDRDPYDTTHLPAHIEHTRCDPCLCFRCMRNRRLGHGR